MMLLLQRFRNFCCLNKDTEGAARCVKQFSLRPENSSKGKKPQSIVVKNRVHQAPMFVLARREDYLVVLK